jgi:hypothetical protein
VSKCQSRTNGPQQRAALFDHLVGAGEEGLGNREDDTSSDLGRSSSRQPCPDCITATRGYDFREGPMCQGKALGRDGVERLYAPVLPARAFRKLFLLLLQDVRKLRFLLESCSSRLAFRDAAKSLLSTPVSEVIRGIPVQTGS